MPTPRHSLLSVLLLAALAATTPAQAAKEPLVVLQGSAAAGETTTLNLRQEQPAGCAMPSVGDCASCSVSCATGQAAVCKPGKVASALGDGSCQREPVCRCENASAPSTRP